MAGCGYVCPACEGREVDEEGNPCHWCRDEGGEEEKAGEIKEN